MVDVKEVDFKDLYQNGVLVNLQVRMWGATSKLPDDMLNVSEEDKNVIRAVHDLIDDKTLLELLRTIKNESLGFIKRHSLPSPVREMQFVPKNKIELIDQKLEEQQKRYYEVVDQLLDVVGALEKDFAKKHPTLYTPDKYPRKENLKSRFLFKFVFRMFSVPDATLQAVSPAIFKSEVKKFQEEMDEMKQLIISEVGREFLTRIDSLKKQCIDGTKINSRTIESINKLLEKFDDLWDGFVFNKDLRQMVEDIKEYMVGTDAEMLKVDDDFRKLIGEKMQDFSGELEKIKDVKPKRALAI